MEAAIDVENAVVTAVAQIATVAAPRAEAVRYRWVIPGGWAVILPVFQRGSGAAAVGVYNFRSQHDSSCDAPTT